jgi:histidine triad (HIT) family protein
MGSCAFCDIVQDQAWAAIVSEDEQHMAIMNIHPTSVGHTLVITKKHYADIFEMGVEDISKLFVFVSKAARAVKRAMDAEGISIVQNNGPATGQKIPHVHVHIIPSTMDELFVVNWQKIDVSEEELAGVAARIKEALSS